MDNSDVLANITQDRTAVLQAINAITFNDFSQERQTLNSAFDALDSLVLSDIQNVREILK